jgi:hypothetical protein
MSSEVTQTRRWVLPLVAIIFPFIVVLIIASLFVYQANSHKNSRHAAANTPTMDMSKEYSQILSISMSSPSEGWAVGNQYLNGPPQGVFFHYHNDTWASLAGPDIGQKYDLHTIYMDSATDGWASGNLEVYTGNLKITGTIILHYDGTSWKKAAILQGTPFSLTAAFSSTDVWGLSGDAWGMNGIDQLLHFTGQTWSKQTLPITSQNRIVIQPQGISLPTPNGGWLAVQEQNTQKQNGYDPIVDVQQTDLLQYSAGQWTVKQSLPNIGDVALATTADGTGWLTGLRREAGTPDPTTGGVPTSLVLMRLNRGVWTNVSVTMLPASFTPSQIIVHSTNDVWLIGMSAETNRYDPFSMYHFTGTTWEPFTLGNPVIRAYTFGTIVSANDMWFIENDITPPVGGNPLFIHYYNGSWPTMSPPPVPMSAN